MKRFVLEVPPKAKEEFYFNIVPSAYSAELTEHSAENAEQSVEDVEQIAMPDVGRDNLGTPREIPE